MPQMPDFEAWAIFERMRTTLLHRTTRQLSLTVSAACSVIGMKTMAKNTPGPPGRLDGAKGSASAPWFIPMSM